MFKGRHFDRSVILLCVRWGLQPQLAGDAGGARHQRGPCNDPSVGGALFAAAARSLQLAQAHCHHGWHVAETLSRSAVVDVSVSTAPWTVR